MRRSPTVASNSNAVVAPSRPVAGPSLLQRFRDARRSRRNPVRGASRYESDGPLTRRLETQWINAATHH